MGVELTMATEIDNLKPFFIITCEWDDHQQVLHRASNIPSLYTARTEFNSLVDEGYIDETFRLLQISSVGICVMETKRGVQEI